MRTKFWRGFAVLMTLSGAAATAASCSSPSASGGTDSNTHWLDQCKRDSECGALRCICGVCTKPCSDVSACNGLSNAVCASSAGCDANACLARSGSGGASDGGGKRRDSGMAGAGGSRPDASVSAAGGGGTASGGASGERSDAAFDAHCEPMDARTGSLPCVSTVGYTWDGNQCKDVVCSCDGTACNRLYETTDACESAHADCPVVAAPKNCTTTADCTLVPRGCCVSCGKPQLDEVTALRKDAAATYTAARCAATTGVCLGCAPAETPDFEPACIAGQCTAYDLALYDSCTVDEECELRPKACCDPCGGPLTDGEFVAVTKGSAYDYVACGGQPAHCNVCATTYPAGTSATCDTTTQRCVISTLR